MGLFSFLYGTIKGMEEYTNKKEEAKEEDEMNNSALDDWQKDEVRKGNYSSFNFDEDDATDEDDYYHEDE